MRATVLLLAFASTVAMAQTTTAASSTALTNLPDLSSATATTSSTTDDATTTTKASSATATSTSTDDDASSTSDASTTTDASSTTGTATATSSNSVYHLSDLPTIAGAGIPTLMVPYTDGAPFMQKSTYPEGTVFICVGAILGFLGLCVLAWRGMVAYTINRSVKRAALASIMATDAKAPAWLAGGTPMKKGPGGKLYRQPTDASNLSLEALTANGKKVDPYASNRISAVPTRKEQKRDPSGLFFSPTANTLGGPTAPPMTGLSANSGNRTSAYMQDRNSTYLPAGYYASPSAQLAGGAGNTTLGGGIQSPYSRTTPPESPNHRPASSYLRAGRDQSANRASYVSNTPNRNSAPLLSPTYHPAASSGLYTQPSTSSLAVGYGRDDENLPGSRAPSAYFDDVLEHHGNGPRERF